MNVQAIKKSQHGLVVVELDRVDVKLNHSSDLTPESTNIIGSPPMHHHASIVLLAATAGRKLGERVSSATPRRLSVVNDITG